MKSKIFAGVFILVCCASAILPARAGPTQISITIPISFGGHSEQQLRLPTESEVRTERRLRFTRYALQLADAIVSAIGYRAYSKCLSCLAYPGGGPVGSLPVSVASFSGNRPAEANPLVQPFSNGGVFSLAVSALAYDFVDARIEARWSIHHRMTADIAEIGGHVWGILTWLPEIKTIHQTIASASACGAQWQAKNYGEAFTEGCVNEYYRAGPAPAVPFTPSHVITVCAPATFTRGTYLFTTPNDYIVASGTPCTNLQSPFH